VARAAKQPEAIAAPAPDDAKKAALVEKAAAPNPPPVVKTGPHLGDFKTNPRDGLRYMWIPPGTFLMGCSPGDGECFDDEKPPHQVTISKGLWLGQTDVTQAAYQRVTGTNPSKIKESNLPVNEVSWDGARLYCQAIGGRLPTEAEWEYAARAGSTGARYGNLDAVAWYAGNSGAKPHDVGQKQPNAFNLYDMLGNVFQWTADWHGEKYYQTSEARDPAGPPSGTLRTLRGGSWVYDAKRVRASYRHRFEPSHISDSIGFRCAGN
jgi:formylglycine-generating enzyme required for sulfatase activity